MGIVAAGLALGLVIGWKSLRGTRRAVSPPTPSGSVDMALNRIHYTENRDGMKKWELEADRGEYDREGKRARLAGVRMVIVGDRSLGDIALRAEQADYDITGKTVELTGQVVAQSASGLEFATERIRYIDGRSLLETADRVRFASGNLQVVGIGMEFRTDTRQARILHQVEAHFAPGATP